MTRGDIVLVAGSSGPAGKPRPCVIVQRTSTIAAAKKITVCPLTSTTRVGPPIRPVLHPTTENGLSEISEVEVDWVFTYRTERVRAVLGQAGAAAMRDIDAAMRRWLDL